MPAQQPTRRPKVAGLRRPQAPERSAGTTGHDEQTQVIPKIPADSTPTEAPPTPPPTPAAKPAPRQKRRTTVESKPTTAESTPTPTRRRPRPAKDPAKDIALTPTNRQVRDRVEDTVQDTLPADDVVAESAYAGPGFAGVPADKVEWADGYTSTNNTSAAPKRAMRLPIVLAVVAVLIGGLAAYFAAQWVSVRSSSAAANTALTDAATTSEINGQISAAVNQTFSFDYTNLNKTKQAVQQVLTGTALCQYNQLFKQVQQQAPGQKLVLTTTVQDKGVELLQGGTARVLLLVQQHDTRATTNQTSDSQSMIAVNAVKQGGTWKISAIDTFSGSNPTAGC